MNFILINAQPFKMAALLRRVVRVSSMSSYSLPRITKSVSVNKIPLGGCMSTFAKHSFVLFVS